jgi:protein ImuB
VVGDDGLRAALNRAGLSALPVDGRVLETLGQMGVRTLGDLLRLPRAGIAERFGPGLVLYLARLLGEAPDPRPAFAAPERYRGRLELPAEVDDARALLFAARRLTLELCGFLLGQEAGAQHLVWTLGHAEGRETSLALGLARPGREPERLLELLRERLERLTLPAPVREIRLAVDAVEPLRGSPLELFPRARRRQAEAGERLLERLQARLGRDAVAGLGMVEDHRPERAWSYLLPGGGRASGPGTPLRGGRRPLWLLREPLLLEQRDGRPWHRGGRLDLGRERERIEAGWWDGDEVARDYFVARTDQGERLWVFRELRGRRRWFLHGWFA